MKLLLVEDEEDLANLVSQNLKKNGYAIDMAYDGEEALYNLAVNEYDLLILDLNIPKIDGIDVLTQVRANNHQIKIIILSARSSIEDRVIGLDGGANDYLSKPFDMVELLARIRGLLRINYTTSSPILVVGKLSLNTLNKQVEINETPLLLTKKEYSILEYLVVNKGIVVSSETLIEHVWESDYDTFSNSLKFHMHSLKKKIESINDGLSLIKNIRMQGYVIMEEENETN